MFIPAKHKKAYIRNHIVQMIVYVISILSSLFGVNQTSTEHRTKRDTSQHRKVCELNNSCRIKGNKTQGTVTSAAKWNANFNRFSNN